MNALQLIAQDSLRQEIPEVVVGDTVRVHVRIKEVSKDEKKGKEGVRVRIQVFEGTVIAKQHGGIAETFTVRRVSHGVGVERVFPIHSPSVVQVETIRKGRVRRGKLYYLRGRVGKAAKVRAQIR
ncbi:MAG: 50S ribosomal protein L19 [Oscillospiraceae bacterium]|jgi:large subunit ribosomal protein L19|nr:50S ribosomal protein L19 [Oscillospiraceae bacterium]